MKNGPSKMYYENGKLSSEAIFKNDKLDGLIKVFNQYGNIESGTVYNDGKRVEGAVYYENGQIKQDIMFKNDIQEGPTKIYFKSGRLQEAFYHNGKVEGLVKDYFESGALQSELNYKDGQLDGKNVTYWENGSYGTIDTYQNGHMVNRKSYNMYGKLLFEQNY